jgi:hypothetical protein
MKDILTEELVRQLSLIHFDRAKTLMENDTILEQITAYERYLDKKYSKVPEKTAPPPTPKEYNGGPPYEVLKKYPTSKNIWKIIYASNGYVMDDEAWAEAAFNKIKDKNQYFEVCSIGGKDVYSFISDFMDTDEKYNGGSGYVSIDSKYAKLGKPNFLTMLKKTPSADWIASLLIAADSGTLGTDDEKLAQQAFDAITNKEMYLAVGDLLNQDPYEFCDDILTPSKNYGLGLTVQKKYESLKVGRWHYERIKSGDPAYIARILINSDKGLFGNDKEAWAYESFMRIKDWNDYLTVKSFMKGEDPLEFCKEMFITIVSKSGSSRAEFSRYSKNVQNHYNKIFAYDRMKNNPTADDIAEVINVGLGETMEKRNFGNTKEAYVLSAFNAIKSRDMYEDVNMVFSRIKNREVDVYQLIKKEMSGDIEMKDITNRYNQLIKQKVTPKGGDLIIGEDLKSAREKIEKMSAQLKPYSSSLLPYSNCKSVNQLYAAYSLNVLKTATTYMSNKIMMGRRGCTWLKVTKLGGTGSGLYMRSFDLRDTAAYKELFMKILDNKGINKSTNRSLGNTYLLEDFYFNWSKIVDDYNKTFSKNPNANNSNLFTEGWYTFLTSWFRTDEWSKIKSDIDEGAKDPLVCVGNKIKSYDNYVGIPRTKKEAMALLHPTLLILSIASGVLLTPVIGPWGAYAAQVIIEGVDAAIYLAEGDKYEAGLAAFFAVVPFDFILDKFKPIRGWGKRQVLDLLGSIASKELSQNPKITKGIITKGLSKNQMEILRAIGGMTPDLQRQVVGQILKQQILARLIGLKSLGTFIKFLYFLVKKGYLSINLLAKLGLIIGGVLYSYEKIAKILGITKKGEEPKQPKKQTPKVKVNAQTDLTSQIKVFFIEQQKQNIIMSNKLSNKFLPSVMMLQLFLRNYNKNPKMTFKWGYYDNKTFDEVLKFQNKEKKNSGDGVVGSNTYGQIIRILNSGKVSPIYNNTGVELYQNNFVSDVDTKIETKVVERDPTKEELEIEFKKQEKAKKKEIESSIIKNLQSNPPKNFGKAEEDAKNIREAAWD